MPPPPLDFSRLRTLPLSARANKVRLDDFAPVPADADLPDVLALFPAILIGEEFGVFVRAACDARRAGRPFVLMIGGHVIKTGMSRLIIDLMRRGLVSHLAANGSVSVHDWEIALIGQTSEDVAVYLPDGRFGNWEETGAGLNAAVNEGARAGLGYGTAVGKAIAEGAFPHADASVFAEAFRLGDPATVHVALGNDIIHQHPSWDPGADGRRHRARFPPPDPDRRRPRRRRADEPRVGRDPPGNLSEGAFGGAQPDGGRPREFHNAVFDMVRQYRPLVNVAGRPTASGGPGARGFVFTGHHEILFPLFCCALRREWAGAGAGARLSGPPPASGSPCADGPVCYNGFQRRFETFPAGTHAIWSRRLPPVRTELCASSAICSAGSKETWESTWARPTPWCTSAAGASCCANPRSSPST
jgi:hypothetical protein